MPEGDTIFRAARTLQRALGGATLTRFETVLPRLSRVDEDAPLAGRTVEEVRAAGKHLLVRLSGGLTLRTHMRMNGSWHLYRPGERWQLPREQMRILLETADFVAVAFNVPVAELEDERHLARATAALGPDLLSGDFRAEDAVANLRARPELPIGQALLTQKLVAGAGNVYKSEVLFLCRVHPEQRVAALSDEVLTRLVEKLRALMRANVADGAEGGIVTYTGLRRTTRRADPSERLWVYGRSGAPCRRCGAPISFDKQGLDARVTYWCPRCQPEAAAPWADQPRQET